MNQRPYLQKKHKDLNFFYHFILFSVFNLLISGVIAQNKIVLPAILNENSGMVFSGDTVIWINDSGNRAEVILTNKKGSLLKRVAIPANNRDWECIVQDNLGQIYIGDTGNNKSNFTNFNIYMLDKSFNFIDSISFSYPLSSTSLSYDCEAMCWHQNSLHLFTKDKMNSAHKKACHFAIQPMASDSLSQLGCTSRFHPFVVTDATIHPDQKSLYILTYRYHKVWQILPDTDSRIYILDISKGMEKAFTQPIHYFTLPTFFTTRQYESMAFDRDGNLWIAAEKTAFLKPILKKVKIPRRFSLVRSR